jgi:hypothetical protein
MQLDDEDIREFIAAWEKDFGEAISPEDARSSASQLLELLALLSMPPPSERSHDAAPPS